MNIDTFLKDINTYKDFKLLLDLVIQNTLLLCYKNSKDGALINSDEQSLLEYYQREKNKIIDNINSYTKVFKIEFKNTGITFNEDYTSYLDEIKEIYFNDKQSGFKINRNDTRGLLVYFNEIKTSIWIAFYNSKIKEIEGVQSSASKEDIYPFKNRSDYTSFCSYTQLHIIDHYIDYSYLFQRLHTLKLIHRTTQKDFFKWLFDNKFIIEKYYNSFCEKGQFYSLRKSTTAERENNFNNLFKL